jgi:hypothetical protein
VKELGKVGEGSKVEVRVEWVNVGVTKGWVRVKVPM